MSLRSSALLLLLTVVPIFFAGPALAGGTFVTSVQDGDWSDRDTWDVQIPSQASGDQVQVEHVVAVNSSGAEANVLLIGVSAQGWLQIVTGELTVAPNNPTNVGVNSPGLLYMQGGTMNAGDLGVGAWGQIGQLGLLGSGWSLNADTADFGADAALIIEPTANGPSGLSPLQVTGGTNIAKGSTLTLDVSSYEPTVDDSWTVIDSGGSITGSFETLLAPGGYEIAQDLSVQGLLKITVVPEPGTTLGAATALLTLFALRRRARK